MNKGAILSPTDFTPQMPRWLNELYDAFEGMTESDTKQVAFQGLTHLEQQALLDLLVKETWRHIDDVRVGWDEIQTAIAQNPNLIIRNVFIAKWVKIK